MFKMQNHNHFSEVYKCGILDALWSIEGRLSKCINTITFLRFTTVEILDALWYPQKKCLPLGTAVTTGSTSGGRLWWAGRVRLPYDKKP